MRKTHKGSIKTNKVVHARETEETLLLSYKTFFVGKDNRDNKELPYSCNEGSSGGLRRRMIEMGTIRLYGMNSFCRSMHMPLCMIRKKIMYLGVSSWRRRADLQASKRLSVWMKSAC